MRKEKIERLEEENYSNENPIQTELEKGVSFQDIKNHLTGPVISIALHILLLSILGSILLFPANRSEIRELEIEVVKLTPKEFIPPEIVEIEVITDEKTDMDFEKDNPTTDQVEVNIKDISVNSVQPEINMPNIINVKVTESVLVMNSLFKSRIGIEKDKLLKKHRAKDTKETVIKALNWLRDHQSNDGTWGESKSRQPTFTALALLAFFGYGETISSPDYGNCILKGLQKLVEYSESHDPVTLCAGNGYGHMIVTYALSEAFGLMNMPKLQEPMNKMILTTINGQNTAGGFNYFYKKNEGRIDCSVSGWANQAIKAVFAGGSNAPGIEQSIEKSIACFKGALKAKDGFIYSTNIGKNEKTENGSATIKATAVLCLELLCEANSPEVDDGITYLISKYNVCNWKDTNLPGGMQWALYRWYYQTQAYFQKFQGEGKEWEKWNKMFKTELMRKQELDGHWETPASELLTKNEKKGKADGGHGEASFQGLDNAVYSTALCCLMLEVYYRHLPTFKIVDAR